MKADPATDGLIGKCLPGPDTHSPSGPERRSKLAEAVLLYAAHLQSCYPSDAGNDPLTLGMNQIADVLEQRVHTTAPMAFRLWLTQYAQALFWEHPDRNDPYSVGVCSVAGDLEIALLAWGDPDASQNEFREVVADVFGMIGRDES